MNNKCFYFFLGNKFIFIINFCYNFLKFKFIIWHKELLNILIIHKNSQRF